MKRPTVAIIEDRDGNTLILKKRLEALSIPFLEFTCPSEFEDAMKKNPQEIGLIISGKNMPKYAKSHKGVVPNIGLTFLIDLRKKEISGLEAYFDTPFIVWVCSVESANEAMNELPPNLQPNRIIHKDDTEKIITFYREMYNFTVQKI